MITLANAFFINFDTTIQEQKFFQYRIVLHWNSFRTHPDLLAECTFLSPKQSDQICQDLNLK